MIRYCPKFLIDVAWGLNSLHEGVRFLSVLVSLSFCYSEQELDNIRICAERRMAQIKRQERL
jgi:hypothetical protein